MMSHTNLSRRAILAGAIAVPVPTVPALASPKVLPVQSPPRGEPTAIEKLWIEAQAVKREYEKCRKRCEKLEKVLEREMPDPDPSIVFRNPENAADGLAYWVRDREPHTFKHYMFSQWLEGKLEEANAPTMGKLLREDKDAKGRETLTLELRKTGDEPFPVTEKELALRERLTKRLELSRQYEAQLDSISEKIGLTGALEKQDQAVRRQAKVWNKILRLPASTRSDFSIKLAIYKEFEEDDETAHLISA